MFSSSILFYLEVLIFKILDCLDAFDPDVADGIRWCIVLEGRLFVGDGCFVSLLYSY